MHIKFLDVGTGEAKAAERYLLQAHDHKGEVRPEVRVLRGNPSQVTAVADSLDFKHRYRSAVIAFHPDDQPTQEQIEELLDKFEELAFAGLESDQYCYYAVSHGDHIHIIAPRVELRSGKSMNIAPPNWQRSYDPLRDYFNLKYGWARPDDEARRRLTSSPNIKEAKNRTAAKEMIDEAVHNAVEQRIVGSRQELISYLNSIDGVEVSRETKSAVSVTLEGFEKPIRLKGAVYAQEFNFERLGRELAQTTGRTNGVIDRDREGAFQKAGRELAERIEQRAKYNQGRYSESGKHSEQSGTNVSQSGEQDISKEPNGIEEHVRDVQGRTREDAARDRTDEVETMVDPVIGSGFAPHRVGDRRSGDRKVRRRSDREDESIERSETGDRPGRRERFEASQSTESVSRQRRKLDSALRRRELNDRIRDEINRRIEDTKRDVQRGAGRVDEAARTVCEEFSKRLHSEDERSVEDHREASRNDRDAAQYIGAIQERSGELGELRYRHRSRAYRAIERAFDAVGKFAGAVGGAIKAAINRINSMSWGMRL